MFVGDRTTASTPLAGAAAVVMQVKIIDWTSKEVSPINALASPLATQTTEITLLSHNLKTHLFRLSYLLSRDS